MVVDWIFGSQVSFSNYVQDRSRKVVRTSDHHMLLTDVLVQPIEPIIPPPPADDERAADHEPADRARPTSPPTSPPTTRRPRPPP